MTQRLIQQRIFFFIMVGILAILTVILVWQFITPMLFAFAVVVIMKPIYNWMLNRRWVKSKETRATGATLLVFVLVIAIPAVLIVSGAVSQAKGLVSGLRLEELNLSMPGVVSWLEDILRGVGVRDVSIDQAQIFEGLKQTIATLGNWLSSVLASFGKSMAGFVTSALVVLVMIGVLLPRYKRPGKQDILDIVPYPPEITHLFLDKIDLMITAMFKGIFVIAIVQGAAMGLVLWIVGVPFVMFFTLISMFLSLVPFIGISLLAWPIGILLIIAGNTWQGIFVIAAFVIVVANIDTVLRPFLVPKGAYLNPALVVLSVFGGLGVMGFIGLIYGPVIIILLITSLEVYTKYILRSDLEALQEDGRIDLKELGLVPQENQEDQGMGEMFLTALKNVSARFRPILSEVKDTTSPIDSTLENGE